MTPRTHLSRGWFVEPEIVGRYFLTDEAHTWFDGFGDPICSERDVEDINRADGELHIGVNFGYSMRSGIFELVLPVVGMSAGYCGNCFGGGAFFFGPFDTFVTGKDGPKPGRRNRLSFMLNLTIVRVGVRF
jgi:hypothetical protein